MNTRVQQQLKADALTFYPVSAPDPTINSTNRAGERSMARGELLRGPGLGRRRACTLRGLPQPPRPRGSFGRRQGPCPAQQTLPTVRDPIHHFAAAIHVVADLILAFVDKTLPGLCSYQQNAHLLGGLLALGAQIFRYLSRAPCAMSSRVSRPLLGAYKIPIKAPTPMPARTTRPILVALLILCHIVPSPSR